MVEISSNPSSVCTSTSPQPLPLNVNASSENIVPTNNEEQENESVIGCKRRQPRSDVWLHFSRKVENGKVEARCNYCERKFDGDSSKGTSHLKNHTKSCLMRPQNRGGQQLLTTIRIPNQPSVKLANWRYDPEKNRIAFARMIAKHDLPFTFSEHPFVREWVRTMNPSVRFFTRNTIRNDVSKVYLDMKSNMQVLLDQLPCRVSITTDLWTSDHQGVGYCCITCHYIDDDWKLQKRIIAYELMPPPHSGVFISEAIKSQLLSWNIDNKLFAVTVDNASNNDTMIEDLKPWLIERGGLPLDGVFFHMRCATHILNLIAQDGLRKVETLLQKIRSSVTFTKSSQGRKQKFEEVLAQLKFGKGVIYDVPTRWNSTYLMLERAIELRNVFVRYGDFIQEYKQHLPTREEWEVGKVICDCLKVFYEVTLRFSGVKYPTANLYFKGVCEVYENILEWLTSDHDYVYTMAKAMKEKFDKYWSTVSLIMGIGVILDPRYKMKFLEVAFEVFYGDDSQIYVEKVYNSLNELYSFYEKPTTSMDFFGTSSISSVLNGSSGGGSSSSSSCTTRSKIHQRFKDLLKSAGTSQLNQKSELDKYLDEELFPLGEDEEGNFDILLWWKNTGPKFPTLARIARDILAVPVSTVASESAFSSGGRVITESRSSLKSDVVEALCCLKDWLPNEGILDVGITGTTEDSSVVDSPMVVEPTI